MRLPFAIGYHASAPQGWRWPWLLVWVVPLFQAIFAGGLLSAQPQTVEISGKTMGPIDYNVIAVVEPEVDLKQLPQDVAAVLESINSTMSTYQPDSEISRFNRSETTDWFEVTAETANVVARSLEISRESGGAFDVTVKPLVELWNFGAGRGDFRIPDDNQIASRLANVGYQFLEVRQSPPALKKNRPGLQVDLSAIAKGYAVDRVAEVLRQAGVKSYFVEIGGEVVCRGEKLPGRPWRVGIEKPVEGVRALQTALEIGDRALATSGDYRNFYEVDGKQYSHTIQPNTGRPVEHGLTSVSVICADCMTADALATAVMVLGQAAGWELCQRFDAALMTIEREGAKLTEWRSPNFPAAITAQAAGREPSMWGMFLGTLTIFLLAVGGMAVGVMMGRKPIQGSCGGLSAGNGLGSECGVCQQDTSKCEQQADSAVSSR